MATHTHTHETELQVTQIEFCLRLEDTFLTLEMKHKNSIVGLPGLGGCACVFKG